MESSHNQDPINIPLPNPGPNPLPYNVHQLLVPFLYTSWLVMSCLLDICIPPSVGCLSSYIRIVIPCVIFLVNQPLTFSIIAIGSLHLIQLHQNQCKWFSQSHVCAMACSSHTQSHLHQEKNTWDDPVASCTSTP